MANYSAIKAAVNGYIKANGRKEITGNILNAVLNAVIDSLGRYFQFAGGAMPTDDPGTPDQNVCYLATEPGLYIHFNNIRINNEEVALLFWNGEWQKQTIAIGIQEVDASVDNQVGTPSVDVSYSQGRLVLTFHNIKGEPGLKGDTGDSAGFGTISADIAGGVGNPGVSVSTSGGNTAKNIMFHFTNLKGETGVTSVVATIDDTSGTPSCQVSLVNGRLTLAFSGLKGLKGDTGVSADYPITIYNGLDSDATDQALAAAQGKVLNEKVGELQIVLIGQEKNYSDGHYLKQDGTLGDYATWGVTDFIPYTPGSPVTWKFDGASHNYYLGFFNANKEFISGSDFSAQYNAQVGGRLISASDINHYAPGAAYLRASFNLDYADAEILFGDSSVWTPHEYEPSLQEQIDELKDFNADLFSLSEAEQIPLVGVAYQGKYVYKRDHEINESASNGSFIVPVSVGDRILVRGVVNALANYSVLAFTDDLTTGYRAGVENLIVVDENTNPFAYSYVFTATKSGYLVAWTTARVYGNPLYVEMFRLKDRQKEIFDRYLPESVKIQTFGDSITDNYWGDQSSWVSYVPDNIKNTNLTIVNSAVGGASIGGNGSYNIPHQVMNGYTRDGGTYAQPLDSTADIVVIFAGTNDWSAGQPLDSVKGNLATSFQYIFEHSKAKVVFCTPLQRYNDADQARDTDADGVPINILGMTLRDLCDELINVCKRFSVPVLDLNAEANINRYNILDYSLDGLHPQRWGDAYLSRIICNKIKQMLWGDSQ